MNPIGFVSGQAVRFIRPFASASITAGVGCTLNDTNTF